jgi:hypothetical protein
MTTRTTDVYPVIGGVDGIVVNVLASGTEQRGFEAVGFFGRKNS